MDFETGRLYVVDQDNERINVFAEDGSFVMAFGWGVDTGAPEAQTCTAASGCQAGIAGAGSGQFDNPTHIAVDNDPESPSHHDLYVSDLGNLRVQKFDLDAEGNFAGFAWAIGEGATDRVPMGKGMTLTRSALRRRVERGAHFGHPLRRQLTLPLGQLAQRHHQHVVEVH